MKFGAITRRVSPAIARCELTHLTRTPIDVGLASRQHEAYEQCLRELGCEVIPLPAEPGMPDSVFVEDVAIVLDELAIVTRPGAASRRVEVYSIAEALRPFRELALIDEPATLDGGDVLVAGKEIFLGISSRTNEAGIEQLRVFLRSYGYEVRRVAVRGCLHLKSAVTLVADACVLINPQMVERSQFSGYEQIEVDPSEPGAANALNVNNAVIFPAAYPRTRERMEARGLRVMPLDVSEITKAEGGVTCCSLVFRTC